MYFRKVKFGLQLVSFEIVFLKVFHNYFFSILSQTRISRGFFHRCFMEESNSVGSTRTIFSQKGDHHLLK